MSKRLIVCLSAAALAVAVQLGSAQALPVAPAPVLAASSDAGSVQTVQYWGHRRHGGWRHHHRHGGWGGGWRPRHHHHWGHRHHHGHWGHRHRHW